MWHILNVPECTQPHSKELTVCEGPEQDVIQELKQGQKLVILSSSYKGAVKTSNSLQSISA